MKVIKISLAEDYINGNHEMEYGVVNGAFKAAFGNSSYYCDDTKAFYSTTLEPIANVEQLVHGCTPQNLERYKISEFQFVSGQLDLPPELLQWLQNQHDSIQQSLEDLKKFL